MPSELVGSVLRGLGMVTRCIKSQVLAGIPELEASAKLFVSYESRISALPHMTADVESDVIRAISESGFTNDQKAKLIKAVQSKTYARKVSKERAKLQSCEHFENFITDHLWEDLKTSERSDEATATLLAQLANRLGIRNASEKTLKRMVAVVGFLRKYQCMDQDVLSRLKTSIQRQLHEQRVHIPQDVV